MQNEWLPVRHSTRRRSTCLGLAPRLYRVTRGEDQTQCSYLHDFGPLMIGLGHSGRYDLLLHACVLAARSTMALEPVKCQIGS